MYHNFLGRNPPPFQNLLPYYQDFPLFDNSSTPYFAGFSRRDILQHFVDTKGCVLSNIELAMFMHGHSFSGNEPKNSWIFSKSTMVGENIEI